MSLKENAIAIAVVAAVFLSGYWKGHHDADQSSTVKELTQQNKSLSGTLEAYRATNSKLTEIATNARQKSDANRVAADSLRADADSMRKRLASIVSAHTGATAGSASTNSIISVLAGLLDDATRRAAELSEEAERYRVAGEQCELSYDAVRSAQTLSGKR